MPLPDGSPPPVTSNKSRNIFLVLEQELPPVWHAPLRSLRLRIRESPDRNVTDLVREVFFYDPRRNGLFSPARETQGTPLPEPFGMDPLIPEEIAQRVWARFIPASRHRTTSAVPRSISSVVKQGLGL